MAEGKRIRLSKLAREFNVGIHTIVEFLHKKGFDYDSNPNTKVSAEAVELLEKEYKIDLNLKKESERIILKSHRPKQEVISIDKPEEIEESEAEEAEAEAEEEEPAEVAPEKTKETVSEEKPAEEATTEKEKPKEEAEKEPEVQAPVEKRESVKAAKEEAEPEKEKPEEKPEVSGEAKEKAAAPEKTGEAEEAAEQAAETAEETAETAAEETEEEENPQKDEKIKVVGKINLDSLNQKTRPAKKSKQEKEKKRRERRKKKKEATREQEKVQERPKEEKPQEQEKQEENVISAKRDKLNGPRVVGKIDLPEKKKPKEGASSDSSSRKKRRKRIKETGKIRYEDKQQAGKPKFEVKGAKPGGKKKKVHLRKEVNEEEVQKQIKSTLARLTSKGKSKGSKHRRDKRAAISEKKQADLEKHQRDKKVLKVTEFVSVSELANMMDVNVTEVISSCMSLGLFVSINQRLDAETLSIVAEEFGYEVDFVSVDIQESIESQEEEEAEEELVPRSPIVTVMGHVDHGKTSLLDHIRSTNVIAGEAGGITQHIGAYHVSLKGGRDITFLDTPGHEAFTAMRARGAQVTDIAIIIVAADDNVMPQTVEAINHASAAGVPIVFAINKVDKPGANPEKIKEELANMNYLVEEWGGKYQSQDISAKNGDNIEELLEKVLLEAEMLELKANPEKRASGAIIESSLDRGRGYVATVLVESGTLKMGDVVLAGQYFGHVKAMFNERNQKIETAGPAQPAIILGLDGAPQAGDHFHVMENEREARNIANKREQLAREQGLRSQKHITLDEIGRRIAIGNFQELNLIIKGDVDGSVEALSDALIKLSTEEIQVNVKHKAVGQISESDILLAAASEAIVIGFQVRPSLSARKIAEREQIDIRLYSIIYDAINEIRAAMEGMLSPDIKEEITGTAEVLETFKITKVGTIAGCLVRDGRIRRNSKVRVIRDGIVIYTGSLGSLKRFKDDVKEVKNGYECGLNIENFNDIKVGDHIEAFHEVEVAKQL